MTVGFTHRVIANPEESVVSDAWGTATALGNFASGITFDGDLQFFGIARQDLRKFIERVEPEMFPNLKTISKGTAATVVVPTTLRSGASLTRRQRSVSGSSATAVAAG